MCLSFSLGITTLEPRKVHWRVRRNLLSGWKPYSRIRCTSYRPPDARHPRTGSRKAPTPTWWDPNIWETQVLRDWATFLRNFAAQLPARLCCATCRATLLRRLCCVTPCATLLRNFLRNFAAQLPTQLPAQLPPVQGIVHFCSLAINQLPGKRICCATVLREVHTRTRSE